MALVLLTPPTAEPLDLAEAKLHCRVDVTDDDLLLRASIGAVRDYAENLLAKQLVVARWKQVMDSFPGAMEAAFAPYGQPYANPGNAIKLSRFPVRRVVSIQYLDQQGVEQTVDPSTYVVDASTEPVRITPVFGQIWPIPQPQIGSVWVTFDAGYAAPVTFNASQITVRGWESLAVGDVVRLSNSGGALPAPLQPLTDYYVESIVQDGTYTLAATANGAAIDITGSATGTCYVGSIPEGITQWMKLRLAALYDNRAEAEALTSGSMASMPFVDRLLDGFRSITY